MPTRRRKGKQSTFLHSKAKDNGSNAWQKQMMNLCIHIPPLLNKYPLWRGDVNRHCASVRRHSQNDFSFWPMINGLVSYALITRLVGRLIRSICKTRRVFLLLTTYVHRLINEAVGGGSPVELITSSGAGLLWPVINVIESN